MTSELAAATSAGMGTGPAPIRSVVSVGKTSDSFFIVGGVIFMGGLYQKKNRISASIVLFFLGV